MIEYAHSSKSGQWINYGNHTSIKLLWKPSYERIGESYEQSKKLDRKKQEIKPLIAASLPKSTWVSSNYKVKSPTAVYFEGNQND